MSNEHLDRKSLRYINADIYPQIGDRVRFTNTPDILIVEDVIDSPEKQCHWGLLEEDVGVMLKGKPYGLVMTHLGEYNDVEFVSRNIPGNK
ncbi:MAG: hypothetical protein JWR69_1748 [Pedosphaera sp.]|nr:hypothetical protein [Pedosphaera sp.]